MCTSLLERLVTNLFICSGGFLPDWQDLLDLREVSVNGSLPD